MSKGNQLTFLDNSQDALTPKHEPIPIAKKKPAKKRISPH